MFLFFLGSNTENSVWPKSVWPESATQILAEVGLAKVGHSRRARWSRFGSDGSRIHYQGCGGEQGSIGHRGRVGPVAEVQEGLVTERRVKIGLAQVGVENLLAQAGAGRDWLEEVVDQGLHFLGRTGWSVPIQRSKNQGCHREGPWLVPSLWGVLFGGRIRQTGTQFVPLRLEPPHTRPQVSELCCAIKNYCGWWL